MRRSVQPIVPALAAVAILMVSAGCEKPRPATQSPSSQANKPVTTAAAPATPTAASTTEEEARTPVLVVWRQAHPSDASVPTRLECAAWADGIVLYRRDFPDAPATLVVGRVEMEDVRFVMKELVSNGFFQPASKPNDAQGYRVMARSRDEANSRVFNRPLKAIPDSEAANNADAALWNGVVNGVLLLRETSDSEDLRAHLDSKGEYRGYNNSKPDETWWIKDAGKLWQPSKSQGAGASTTKPAAP